MNHLRITPNTPEDGPFNIIVDGTSHTINKQGSTNFILDDGIKVFIGYRLARTGEPGASTELIIGQFYPKIGILEDGDPTVISRSSKYLNNTLKPIIRK